MFISATLTHEAPRESLPPRLGREGRAEGADAQGVGRRGGVARGRGRAAERRAAARVLRIISTFLGENAAGFLRAHKSLCL